MNGTALLKWAGGKRQLLHVFDKLCPEKFGTYFEPFVGSATLFFHLAQKRPKFAAVLSDSNKDLINVYRSVRDSPREVKEALGIHQRKYYSKRESYYYFVRDRQKIRNNIEGAARMIFLNKTCYNGLYRVNKDGKFNVPHGSYKQPTICDPFKIELVSDILRRFDVTLKHAHYQRIINRCESGDLVYLDPPYLPLTTRSSFTDYTRESFDYDDHVQLAESFRKLNDAKCMVILSNSDSKRIRRLYKNYKIMRVKISRSINCDGANRLGHSELVITNKRAISRNRAC